MRTRWMNANEQKGDESWVVCPYRLYQRGMTWFDIPIEIRKIYVK